jgi:hypothetical protein
VVIDLIIEYAPKLEVCRVGEHDETLLEVVSKVSRKRRMIRARNILAMQLVYMYQICHRKPMIFLLYLRRIPFYI